jgi:hypothetical protein
MKVAGDTETMTSLVPVISINGEVLYSREKYILNPYYYNQLELNITFTSIVQFDNPMEDLSLRLFNTLRHKNI